jgi:hypothetical protein
MLLVLAVVAALLYLQFGSPPESVQRKVDELRARTDPATAGQAPSAPTQDRILSCTADDGSTFYTNAASCSQADLRNRVTMLPADPQPADQGIGQNCLDPEAFHQFLPACAQSFREALELEQKIARAADPLQSPQAEEYCDLISQGASAGCPATSQVFWYLRICQPLLEQRQSR